MSDFSKYLQHKENRKNMNFLLRDGGYDVRDHQVGQGAPERPQMAGAGLKHRQEMSRIRAFQEEMYHKQKQETSGAGSPPATICSKGVIGNRL